MRSNQPLHVQRSLALGDGRDRDRFDVSGSLDRLFVYAKRVGDFDHGCVQIAPHLTPAERRQLERLAGKIARRYERETKR